MHMCQVRDGGSIKNRRGQPAKPPAKHASIYLSICPPYIPPPTYLHQVHGARPGPIGRADADPEPALLRQGHHALRRLLLLLLLLLLMLLLLLLLLLLERCRLLFLPSLGRRRRRCRLLCLLLLLRQRLLLRVVRVEEARQLVLAPNLL